MIAQYLGFVVNSPSLTLAYFGHNGFAGGG
jgi:hypothetical protein